MIFLLKKQRPPRLSQLLLREGGNTHSSTRRRDTELEQRSFGNSYPRRVCRHASRRCPGRRAQQHPLPAAGRGIGACGNKAAATRCPAQPAPTGAAPTAGHAQGLAAEPRASLRRRKPVAGAQPAARTAPPLTAPIRAGVRARRGGRRCRGGGSGGGRRWRANRGPARRRESPRPRRAAGRLV